MVIIICHYRNEKQLEPKGIPKSFLGKLLQGRHHSTIRQLFLLSLVTVLEAFAK